jgi:hypothetical protein
VESAQRTLAKLYGIPENHVRIMEEMDEIREQFEAESDDQKWHEFITAPRMFYRIALGMVLQSLQQLSGANYFFYYVSRISAPYRLLFAEGNKILMALFSNRVQLFSKALVFQTALLPRSSSVL